MVLSYIVRIIEPIQRGPKKGTYLFLLSDPHEKKIETMYSR